MSTIIKGMDMPKDCWECPFRFIADEIHCVPFKGLSPHKGYIDCPLIEIPTPHGRLIDEDEIRGRDMSNYKTSAPTILEAEE